MSAAENILACFDDLITSPKLKKYGKQKSNPAIQTIVETIYIMDDVPFQETWLSLNPEASPNIFKALQEGIQLSSSNNTI